MELKTERRKCRIREGRTEDHGRGKRKEKTERKKMKGRGMMKGGGKKQNRIRRR
jgi:hypothetical protein